MSELSGNLESVGLASLLQFLSGLGKNGCVLLTDDTFSGTLFLENGKLIGARFDHEAGLPAFEAIGLVLRNGQFTFTSEGEHERNLTLGHAQLEELLGRMAAEGERIAAAIPSFSGVPVQAVDEGPEDEQVVLHRGELRLLMQLDGSCPVSDLAWQYGLFTTLRQLAHLVELGLVVVRPCIQASPEPLRPLSLSARLVQATSPRC